MLLGPLRHHYRRMEGWHGDLGFLAAASADPLGSYVSGAGRIYGHRFDRYQSEDFYWEKNLFPGFVSLGLGALGIVIPLSLAIRSRSRGSAGETSFKRLRDLHPGVVAVS